MASPGRTQGRVARLFEREELAGVTGALGGTLLAAMSAGLSSSSDGSKAMTFVMYSFMETLVPLGL